MKVGDLVQHSEKIYRDVTWLGIITMRKVGTTQTKVFVEWATGGHGWQYCSDLEVVSCK